MDSTVEILQIILLAILLCLSGFFSAAETAFTSLSRLKVRQMEDEGMKGAHTVKYVLSNPKKLLGSILVGNNIVNIAATSISTSILLSIFGKDGVVIATVAMTLFILLFGEITPKNIAANNPSKIAGHLASAIKFIMMILTPLVFIFNVMTNIIFRLFGIKDTDKSSIITEEDIKVLLNVAHEESVLEMEEREIINNVFEFGDMQAKHAMVQRIDMVAIDIEDSYDEIIDIFKEDKLSRMPVYKETIDDIVGILNIKDLMFMSQEEIDNFKVEDFMREPYFTYEFKKITQLLEDMKTERAHIAIVLDEYGGTAGLLTIEDLVEVLVGDIEDEYDEDEDEIVQINDHEFLIDGSTKLEEVGELLGVELESEDFDSIGGYIIGHLDRLPEENEVIELENAVFCIQEIEKNRIKVIKMLTGVEKLPEQKDDDIEKKM